MKMNIKNYIKVALACSVAVLTTACQDWLTIYPQTQIVEENFWEDKNDLEGVRYAIYKNMCGCVEKMALWGDLRSDSYDVNSSLDDNGVGDLYREIREGRMERDSANSYFDWAPFYTTINYCNKVLQHGKGVLAADKQFTESEWLHMQAEVVAARALNYFYLIRAFKDVPYTTAVVNKDTETRVFPATNQLVVLDSIIVDLENVKGKAYNRTTSKRDTKGCITNCAIYAMLSDMYLWRASLHKGRRINEDNVFITNIPNPQTLAGAMQDETTGRYYVKHTVKNDYQAAADYADLALASLADQTEKNYNGMMGGRPEVRNYGLSNCNMIRNDFANFTQGATPQMNAYQSIFGSGNSDESIFELQFSNADQRKNEVLGKIWGYSGAGGKDTRLSVCNAAISAIYGNVSEQRRDSRTWFSACTQVATATSALSSPYSLKYCNSSLAVLGSRYEGQYVYALGVSTNEYSNWIIYRMSDVMLQKAEALACLGKTEDAWRIVNAIHRRWYCNDRTGSTDQPGEDVTSNYGKMAYDASSSDNERNTMGNASNPSAGSSAIEKAEAAVMNERQIEFLGEGKRWFDLVRYAERHAADNSSDQTKDPREWSEDTKIGDGKQGVDKMVDTYLKQAFTNSYNTLKSRFKNRYGLYNLIYYKEVQCSKGKLEQNPVWNKSMYEK